MLTSSFYHSTNLGQDQYAIPVEGGEPELIVSGQTNCAVEVRAIREVQSLAVMIGEGLGSRIDLLDPKNGEVATLLDGTDGERGVEYTSWDVRRNEEGKLTIAVVRSTSDQPWEVWCGQQQVGQNTIAIALQQVSAMPSHWLAFPLGIKNHSTGLPVMGWCWTGF